MMKRSLLYVMLSALLLLFACGGGSTVTAVSLTADDNSLFTGERTMLTAKAEASITDSTLGEKVTFSVRHNESGSHLDVINDRLDGQGEAKAYFIAGQRDGVDIVEASFESGARATVTISVGEVVVVGNIRLEAFSLGQAGEASTGWRIRATVTDTRGLPAPEITVDFSTNNGSLTPGTETTNNAGIAETELRNLEAGRGARVWASAGGISVSIQVGEREPAPDPDPDPDPDS